MIIPCSSSAAVFSCGLALLMTEVAGQYTAAPTVTLTSGVLHGTTTSLPAATAGVNKFLGIPFARSPPERFSPPSPPQPWTSPKNVSAFTPSCIQQFNYPEITRNFTMTVFNNPGSTPPTESEDCLYLNVYAPNTAPPPGGRPVMFWIYGGGNQFGTAMQQGYDGSSLASYQDVILVAPNYRTNVFGFSSSPGLPLTSRNAGFLDQKFALQWVQDNIARFGGNPDKVTIFGESAGAGAVDRFITTSAENPQFRAAIMESGQASYGRNSGQNFSVPLAAWKSLASGLNCTGDDAAVLSCVRKADALTIKSIVEHQALNFVPIPDNVTQLEDPAGARASGNIAKVPVMIGSNSQEGRVFQLGQNNLTQFLTTTFGGNQTLIKQITDLYPKTGNSSDYDVISEIYTDYAFTCPIPIYTAATQNLSVPIWRYYFDASFVNTNPAVGVPLGVFHSSEIALIYDTYPRVLVTPQEVALTQFMQGAWANFAKNPQRGPGWTAIGSLDNATEVGALGSNGTGGVTIFDPAYVDRACKVFAQTYNSA